MAILQKPRKMLLLLIVLLASTTMKLEASTAKRKVDLRIFDKSYTTSKEDLERKLTKAALTERGYSKTTTFTQTDDSGEQFLKIVRYRKSVPCQDMANVEDELRKRIPGVWGREVSDQVRKEALKKREKNQKCTAGIEIHFPLESCRQKTKNVSNAKRGIPACSIYPCMFCFRVTFQ
ncbi:hypothetical protein OS493_007777 [Desmophyllum pertusum]|uniref:Uncharacterized protein n=1 Tax=Desmophyllum pertusum TaxID=174260 RepID=A0A9X0CNH0_9CNID|nr:hypothetical protein OS493_007777 [Desmophyllum pertusum]